MLNTAFPILSAHWSEFLFDCTTCPNASECMEQGICQHEMPTDGDHEVDDKLHPGVIKSVKASIDLENNRLSEITANLPTNFQYQYND